MFLFEHKKRMGKDVKFGPQIRDIGKLVLNMGDLL